jgi:hypothetical protein
VAHRTTPLMLDYASATTLSAEVELPARFDAVLPAPIKLETPFGRFSQSARKEGKGFRVDAFFSQPQRRVAPEQYPGLVDFAVAVDRSEARAAELTKK